MISKNQKTGYFERNIKLAFVFSTLDVTWQYKFTFFTIFPILVVVCLLPNTVLRPTPRKIYLSMGPAAGAQPDVCQKLNRSEIMAENYLS
ncbi:hypothetical protein Hanom_Chr08g00698291 [Helianthus anomalus]